MDEVIKDEELLKCKFGFLLPFNMTSTFTHYLLTDRPNGRIISPLLRDIKGRPIRDRK